MDAYTLMLDNARAAVVPGIRVDPFEKNGLPGSCVSLGAVGFGGRRDNVLLSLKNKPDVVQGIMYKLFLVFPGPGRDAYLLARYASTQKYNGNALGVRSNGHFLNGTGSGLNNGSKPMRKPMVLVRINTLAESEPSKFSVGYINALRGWPHIVGSGVYASANGLGYAPDQLITMVPGNVIVVKPSDSEAPVVLYYDQNEGLVCTYEYDLIVDRFDYNRAY